MNFEKTKSILIFHMTALEIRVFCNLPDLIVYLINEFEFLIFIIMKFKTINAVQTHLLEVLPQFIINKVPLS